MVKSYQRMPLSRLDDIFTTEQERQEKNLERIKDINIDDIDSFPNHPFNVVENEDLYNLRDSIVEKGVISPILVRPKNNGRYEVISGHRRMYASKLADKINNIQNENVHDDYVLNLKRPEWKAVLSVYAVVVSSEKNGSDVMTITEEKTVILKEIFWKMNELSYYVADELDDNGNTKKILYININSKTVEEMIDEYALNNEQQKQLNELLDDKYESLWSNVVYGNSTDNFNVVDVALSQVGNKGGEPYWRWYGFNSRIEWCAVFVSWVYNQVGELNIAVPKFSTCHTQGVPWFKTLGLWKDKGYVPKSGDVIFFDWEQDGHVDHVGIVETSDGKEVYTIEGNSRDEVKRKKYKIKSKYIYGYGIPKH